MGDPIDVVLQFIQSINEKDVNKLNDLMSDNHKFIDASGKIFKGRSMMLQNWRSYFEWFPNYFIEIEQYFTDGDVVGVFGYASGNYRGNTSDEYEWRLPCAWRAQIKEKKIDCWQVYSDTKKIYSIMEQYEKEEI